MPSNRKLNNKTNRIKSKKFFEIYHFFLKLIFAILCFAIHFFAILVTDLVKKLALIDKKFLEDAVAPR